MKAVESNVACAGRVRCIAPFLLYPRSKCLRRIMADCSTVPVLVGEPFSTLAYFLVSRVRLFEESKAAYLTQRTP